MNRDQLEFAISQYLDGTLAPLQHAALQRHLERDVEARRLLEEYRSLGALLDAGLPAVPAIDHEALSAQLRAVVADAQPPAAKTYQIGWWGWPTRLAAAAALLVFGFVWFQMYLGPHPSPTGAPGVAPSPPMTRIAVMTAAPAQGPAIERITVGPSPAIANAPASARHEDLANARRGKVVIATGKTPPPESGFPY